LLFDVYSEIGQFYKEFEEYAESLEEGIRLPGVGFEIDRHLYANSKRIIDACKASDEVDVIRRANGEIGPDCAYVVRVRNGASQAIEIDEALADDLFAAEENLDADDPRFEGDGEDVEDEDDEDREDDDEEDDDGDAGGSNGSGPGNSSAGGNNAGGNNIGGPSGNNGKSGGNNAGGNPNGKSGK
jgi:S-layer domain protein